MLTKEEVIILRSIFLEFGDEELRQKRLEFPYENMEYEEVKDVANSTGGKRYKANVSGLIENLKSFGRSEIDDEITDNFYTYILGDNRGVGGDFEGVVVVEGKQFITDREDDDSELVSLKKYSKSDFFINLRMGLYYKGLGKYDKAIEHLDKAHKAYCASFYDTINSAAGKLCQFLEQFYDFNKKVIKEPYSIEKQGPLPEVPLTPELLIAMEEMPSFHLGELYLSIANENFSDYEGSKNLSILDVSKENYARAIDYLEESDKWCKVLYYGQDFNDPLISQLKQLDVIRFPISPFKRNSYWEVNNTTARNQLKRIEEEKFLSTIKVLEKPDPAFIEKRVSEVVFEEKKKRELLEEDHQRSREELKAYKDIIPDLASLSLPHRTELKLVYKVFKESEKAIYWLDKHFMWQGLRYLGQGKLGGKLKDIKILTSPVNLDDCFKDDFKKFKKAMEDQGTQVELRVVIKEYILEKMHDRWIITDKNAYNVPPVGSIAKKQDTSITEEKDRKIILEKFNDLWNKGIDILTGDWAEIQRVKEELKQRRRWSSGR